MLTLTYIGLIEATGYFIPPLWSAGRYPYYHDGSQIFENPSFESEALARELELQRQKNSGEKKDPPSPEVRAEKWNLELKFTHLTPESEVASYKKTLHYSKIFKFSAEFSTRVNVILVSTSINYHPQIIISEAGEKDQYSPLVADSFTSFNCVKGKTYVAEIGHKIGFDPAPFDDVTSGGFTVILSSTTQSIKDTMMQESIAMMIWGFKGIVPFSQGGELLLYHQLTNKMRNYGKLNYNITPFYNNNDGDEHMMIYYHLGTDEESGDMKRATEMKLVCNRNAENMKTFYGKEPVKLRYKCTVESQRICGIMKLLK